MMRACTRSAANICALSVFVAICTSTAVALGAEIERSGVSFGAALGLGVVSQGGAGFAGSLQLGYALSESLVAQGTYETRRFSTDTVPSASSEALKQVDFYRAGIQMLVAPRLWIRPEVGLARSATVRYEFYGVSDYRVSHLKELRPALSTTFGFDAATGKHVAFELAFSNYVWDHAGQVTYACAFLAGVSYY